MASCSKRDNNGSLFTPKKIHILSVSFLVILIRRSFLRKHGKSLLKSAVMKVPSGATWKVELLKHKDEVSFAKGWEKFIAYYSIDYGDFLVFEYQGNSLFNVFIIDKSFTEVGDPWNNTDAAEKYEGDHGGRPAENKCHPSGTPLSAARDSPGFYFTWTAKCTTKSAIKRKEE
ncbi:hypothetical protein POTOM_026919 [Populus tomentosa]|uniref:TF-B3 domain-containing protein n=1 Tax=Populus tomentosa TaxID=118781 RepID=A0A8X7ZAJ8_POPTO|nr:hypothetical protein POTOM_026919 [Populus tomentosa]